MNPTDQQPLQSVIPPQPIQQHTTKQVSNGTRFPKVLLSLLGVVVVVGFISAAYFLGTQKNVSVPPTEMKTVVYPTKPVTGVPTNISTKTIGVTANWKTYTSQQYHYSLKYPSILEISQQDLQNSPYSVLFIVKQTQPGPSGFPSLYVSVIPDGFTNTGSVIYNFMQQNFIDKAIQAKINDILQDGDTSTGWNTYNKLPDTVVASLIGTTIENDKVWEGENGLKDRRVFIKKKGFTYMIGTYYQSAEDLNNYQVFLTSFQFIQ